MRIELPKFNEKKELFKHLIENKDKYISQKRALTIPSESFSSTVEIIKDINVLKAAPNNLKSDEIFVKVVMNTTNLMDSHSDVHVSGIWNKTLKDNKSFYHLQEHRAEFDKVISDSAKAYVQTMAWNELGFNYIGTTDALIFESVISEKRNPVMYEQYKNRWVKNHSVGMQYVKLDLAINDNESEKEFDFWNKYIYQIANRKDAENQGYFWVIQEAKLMEGSAVVFGSNFATPTQETIEHNKKSMDMNGEQNIDYNIEFINMMIPHHKEAIKMVNKFTNKVDNEELQTIMTNIKKTQNMEIQQMEAIKNEEENKTKIEPDTTTLSNKNEPLEDTHEIITFIKSKQFFNN